MDYWGQNKTILIIKLGQQACMGTAPDKAEPSDPRFKNLRMLR